MISRTCAKRHMGLSVKGALNQIPNNDKMSFANHDDGRPMTNRQLRAYLRMADFEGKKLLPMGECDNFDYQEGCRGHDVVLLVHDYEFEEGNG
jgi:hypothetical protein